VFAFLATAPGFSTGVLSQMAKTTMEKPHLLVIALGDLGSNDHLLRDSHPNLVPR
jgi:hypothetical protein